MPVFNIAANTVPARPVDAYYEGKAVRLALKNKELANQEAQQRVDANLPKANVEDAQQQARVALSKEMRALSDDQRESVVRGARSAAAYKEQNPDDAEGITQAFADGFGPGYQQAMGDMQGGVPADFIDAIVASEDYKLEDDSRSDYTLGKGRYSGKTNELIAGVAPEVGGESSNQRDDKIRDAAKMLNGDVETATKIVDGHITMRQNEKTGMIELMDKVTGKAWEVPLENEEFPVARPAPGKTLWDLSGHATGPISAIKAAGNIPAAWIGLKTSKKVTQARQTFRTTGQNFVRALAINPRFPVGEQNRIREEISLVPAVFDSPSLMRDRMVSLDHDLRLRMEQAGTDAKNNSLPEDTRKAQASNANEIKNFLEVMGVPNLSEEAPDYVGGEDKYLWPHLNEVDRKKLYPQYEGQ